MSELKTRWVYFASRDYHWNKPDYSSFEITDEELTMEEAQALVWGAQCEEANNVDYDREMCVVCYGTGEVDGEECAECGGSGEVEEFLEWVEHVERHTSSWLERYDPAKHFEVPSELPEHKLWKANEAVDMYTRQVRDSDNRISELEKLLNDAKTKRAKVAEQLAAAKLDLKETEEKYA